MHISKIVELMSWFGMMLILIGYTSIVTKRWHTESRIYYAFNLFEAVRIIANAVIKRDFPVIVLNTA